jgi:transcriptional regulator with XRE-family HTH domain
MGRDTVPGFADQLRLLRESKDWSIDDLAEKSGVHRDSISKLEREERSPSLRLAFQLADALGVKVDSLRATGDDKPKAKGKGKK